MSTIIREKRLISLNSANATQSLNGSFNSNLVFDFANILSPDKNILYVEAGVQNAQIPVSMYTVDVQNNVFNYRISGINFNIQVSPGNYTFNTLTTVMTTLFAINSHTFTYALNRNTNVMTLTYTSAGTWQEIQPSSIYYILGFEPDTTYTIVSNTITFPGLFNVINPKKLKIFSTYLAIESYDSVGSSTTNLIETISVNASSFGLILYENLDSSYGHLRASYLSTIDIQIRDELNNFINFNGVDWTMTIVLIVYKKLETPTVELTQPGNVINEAI